MFMSSITYVLWKGLAWCIYREKECVIDRDRYVNEQYGVYILLSCLFVVDNPSSSLLTRLCYTVLTTRIGLCVSISHKNTL